MAGERRRQYYQDHKEVILAQGRDYYARNKEKVAARTRAWRLNKVFGMSEEDYEAKLVEQGGGCALCGVKPEVGKRKFPIDHDPETGIVRGILCLSCNTALGRLGDTAESLMKVLAYLRKEEA